MKIRFEMILVTNLVMASLGSFNSIKASESEDIFYVEQISARSILKDFRTSDKRSSDEESPPLLLIYEGVQTDYGIMADKVAMKAAESAQDGLYNGSITKLIKIEYKSYPTDLISMQPDALEKIEGLLGANTPPMSLSNPKSNLLFIQDAMLGQNPWHLDRTFQHQEPTLKIHEIVDLLEEKYLMHRGTLDALDETCGEETLLLGDETTSVRNVLFEVLEKFSSQRNATMGFQILPVYTSKDEGALGCLKEYPEISSFEGWTINIF